jgi:Zn-dependent protease with chaperone function
LFALVALGGCRLVAGGVSTAAGRRRQRGWTQNCLDGGRFEQVPLANLAPQSYGSRIAGAEVRPLGLVAALLLALIVACAPPASVRPTEDPGPAGSSAETEEVNREQSRLLERRNAEVAADKAWIEQVGRRLLSAIPEHPRIQFLLARGDPSINASATFSGVVISGGMLRFLESDDELAVVLGHEVAHITQGHVLRGTVASVVLNAIAICADIFAPGTGRLASSIGQFFLSYYTQTQEREADDVGLRYAFRAGYDPRAAAEMTERLAVEVPGWMSAGYFASHLSSIDSAVLARREADELLSGAEPTGNARTANEAVADVESAVTTETPLVLVDEGVPGGQTGFNGTPEPIPFFSGHHHEHRLDDPSGRTMHDRVIHRPVPLRPLPAHSSMHTRAR